ncbi:MAG: hypothetical protein AB7N80_11720, partial [Bdellovibrionales bacterium]
MGWLIRLTVLISLLSVLGCGDTGGNGAPSGRICPSTYDPLPVDLNPNNEASKPQKLAFGTGAGGITQFPGTYTYENAELFYRNSKTGVQMHISDALSKRTKLYELSISCVSGLKPGSPPFNMSSSVVSGMSVEPNKLASFSVRNFLIRFQNAEFPQKKTEEGDSSQFEAPSKVYDGAVTQYFLYKIAATDQVNFETRSRLVRGDERIDVVVRYKRT